MNLPLSISESRPLTPADFPALTPLEANETRAALDRYFNTRCVARGLCAATRKGRRRIVERFLFHCGRPIWKVTPHDYDRFVGELVLERNLALSTQRYYQCAIDRCFRYLQGDVEYQSQLHTRVGDRVVNPIDDDNRVVHRRPDQGTRARKVLSRDELTILFASMADFCELLSRDAGDRLRRLCVQRDRVAFMLQYYLALRVGELANLRLDSFEEAPWARDLLGPFGQVCVTGKGSIGQGPKTRMVPVTTIDLRLLLEWYLRQVRPQFPNAKTEGALFLSRHGRRLSRSYFVHAFRRYVRIAGLPRDATTHSLRRASLTHECERMDMAFAQYKAGHVYMSTTQQYVPLAEEHLQEQAHALVLQSLRNASRLLPHDGVITA